MVKKNWNIRITLVTCLAVIGFITSCGDGNGEEDPGETDFTDLLTNQVDQIIIPSMEKFQEETGDLVTALNGFASSTDEANLLALRTAYQEAYLAYQAVAVHDYFATSTLGLVEMVNLYPVNTELLASLIETESYNFSADAQKEANGFPAIDYMLYGPSNVLTYFGEDAKRLAFLQALVTNMKERADLLASNWKGDLRNNFIGAGGTSLGSAISAQLNGSLVYYEIHIRGNKVGIPIGRQGPNDTPFTPDATKIEGYHQSVADGSEDFTLMLLKAAIEEMEDLYLGSTADGTDGQGYDDLLVVRNQSSTDTDIKGQFAAIYTELSSRSSISGDEDLYNEVQALVTVFKSDLFPMLNVQDADGANDGD